MYEPKPYEPGGDKPGYGKPGGENPVEDEPGGDPTGECTCANWPVPDTSENDPFRRFLLALKDKLKDLPADAIEKFETELKDAEKESQGIAGIVSKYKEFYDKQLDCKLAEARNWKAEIARLLEGKITDAAKSAIKDFRKKNYEDEDNNLCCEGIALRDELNKMRDCLEQAKRKEEESKQDYDEFKGFQKTLSDRFDSLKTLFEQAKGFATEQRYQAVFAVSLEFDEIYANLSTFRDWDYARKQCPKPTDDGDGQTGEPETPSTPTEGGDYAKTTQPETPPTTPPEGGEYGEQPTTQTPPETGGYDQSAEGVKKELEPDKFKKRLANYLRTLVLARYQRFRWQQAFLTKTADAEKRGKACADFRKERQKQFIDEADEIPPSDTSGGGNGDYGEKPPPDEYTPETPPTGGYVPGTPPTGGYQGTPPTGGSYEQKPPAGNYPDKPTPPYGGQDTPVQQPDTYQGRQKK